MPDPEKSESVPPVTVTSVAVKSVAGLSRVNAIVAVWPDLRVDVVEAIWIVGMTVSITIEGVSDPAVPGLPAASANEPAATEMAPGVVDAAVGENVAE